MPRADDERGASTHEDNEFEVVVVVILYIEVEGAEEAFHRGDFQGGKAAAATAPTAAAAAAANRERVEVLAVP